MRKGKQSSTKSKANQTVIYKKTPVYKTPKSETKYTDLAVSNTSVTSSGYINSLLSNLVRGDNGLNQFQGNMIYPKYVQVDYYTYSNQTYNAIRIMVFQWMDSATPVLSGVLANTAAGIAPISQTLVTNKGFIKVLYDDRHIIAPTAGGDTTPVGFACHMGKAFIPGSKIKPIRYNSSSNVVQDGNIYILAVSDDSVPTYPAMYFHSRVAYTDWDHYKRIMMNPDI